VEYNIVMHDEDEQTPEPEFTANDFLPSDVANGRPPRFTDPETLAECIAGYFNGGCAQRTVIVGRADNKRAITIPMLTITGLTIWLGFADRSSFYDYEKKQQFTYILKRARIFIEQDYEEALKTTPNATGIIFALKQFGWKDTHEINASPEMASTREKIKGFSDERTDDEPKAHYDIPVDDRPTDRDDSEEV
jgi:hypothetical protein